MILKINNIPQFTDWAVTAPFGSVDDVHHAAHKGVDFAVSVNTPVPSFGDGVVTQIADEGARSFGRSVHILTPQGDDVIYGHLSSFQCQVGQHVKAGDIIALSGSTGDSTGPHLHVQVMHAGQAVDPMVYFHMDGDDGSTGIPYLDHISEIWKQNAERIFHISPHLTNKPLTPVEEIQRAVVQVLEHIGHTLNENSAQIATFAILICATGVMISPLVGMQTSKWYGRMLGCFFGGVIWRTLIAS